MEISLEKITKLLGQKPLSDKSVLDKISVYDCINSTNTKARELMELNASSSTSSFGAVIIAREQISGRGQRGKTFLSPRGGIYMSIILPPDHFSDKKGCDNPPDINKIITQCSAAIVCEVIKGFGFDPKIKWVNDILLNDKKVCGILCESKIECGIPKWFVVGIGLNFVLPRGGFHKDIIDRAGALFEGDNSPKFNINELIAELISSFFSSESKVNSTRLLTLYDNYLSTPIP